MQASIPTLVVDIGNTLIARDRPGPFARAVEVLAAAGTDVADAGLRRTVARGLLTGYDRNAAADHVARDLALAPDTAAALRDSLHLPEGDAVLLDGAEPLLRAAKDAGWRVIAATNAAIWSEDLPDRLLRHLEAVVSSGDVGLLKQDAQFWVQLTARYGLDPRCSLVTGDNPVADGSVPAEAGYCPVVLTAAGPAVRDVASWLTAAPPPPPDAVGLVAGTVRQWAGQPILEAPHLSALVKAVTRYRVRVHSGHRRPFTTNLVRRRDQSSALVVPVELPAGVVAWLTAVSDNRNSVVPADLSESLRQHGLSLDGLPERELRHLVSMVREARDPEVRRMRISDILTFARHYGDQRGEAYA